VRGRREKAKWREVWIRAASMGIAREIVEGIYGIVEGLYGKVEGLCRKVEGLCSGGSVPGCGFYDGYVVLMPESRFFPCFARKNARAMPIEARTVLTLYPHSTGLGCNSAPETRRLSAGSLHRTGRISTHSSQQNGFHPTGEDLSLRSRLLGAPGCRAARSGH